MLERLSTANLKSPELGMVESVNTILIDFLTSPLPTAPEEAENQAKQAAALLLNSAKDNQSSLNLFMSFLLHLWYTIFYIAKQLPWDSPQQDRLTIVVNKLRKLPLPPNTNTFEQDPIRPPVYYGWLDSLDWAFAHFEFAVPLDPPTVPTKHDRESLLKGVRTTVTPPEWTNLNAFSARLLAAFMATDDEESLGIEHFSHVNAACYAFQEALEEVNTPAHFLTTLPPVACWLLFAGCILRRMYCSVMVPFRCRVRYGHGQIGTLYSGPGGFCPERWTFWRTRLELLDNDTELEEQAKMWVQRALQTMQEVEAVVPEPKEEQHPHLGCGPLEIDEDFTLPEWE